MGAKPPVTDQATCVCFPPKAAVAGSLAPNRRTRPFSDIQARLPSGRCWPEADWLLSSGQRGKADDDSGQLRRQLPTHFCHTLDFRNFPN
jgi:hypothetical protein